MTRVTYHLGFHHLLLGFSLLIKPLLAYNVLMATMGGTKSHTVPFVALGTSLRSRGHNVTLLSAFPGPAANNGLHELVPSILEVIYDLPRTSVLRWNSNLPRGIFTASRARRFFPPSNLALDPYLILLHDEQFTRAVWLYRLHFFIHYLFFLNLCFRSISFLLGFNPSKKFTLLKKKLAMISLTISLSSLNDL